MTQIKANEDAGSVAEVARPHGGHGGESGGGGHGGGVHDQGGHGGHGHGEPLQYPYVQHHFDSPKQQFEAGKLGIWLFLVTEILFFSGLFCAYTIYRAQHPEVFYWAHFYLDTNLGALNTIVLIFSSLTAAWAVRNAQLGQVKLLRLNILLTIACALTFMGVKYVEYSHKFHDGLLPMRHFDPAHEVWEVDSFKEKHPEAAAAMIRLMGKLEERKAATAALEGRLPARQPLALVPAVLQGSPPPDGGEPSDAAPGAEGTSPATAAEAEAPVVAPEEAQPAAEEAAEPVAEAEDAAEEPAPAAVPAKVEEEKPLPDDVFLANELRRLSVAEATPLLRAGVLRRHADGPYELVRPERAGVFFSIYFFMTGLHGVHVVIGIGIWIWMLVRAGRRKFGPKYFGPIDFSALYWHLVDLIWIYLFPLLYLIH